MRRQRRGASAPALHSAGNTSRREQSRRFAAEPLEGSALLAVRPQLLQDINLANPIDRSAVAVLVEQVFFFADDGKQDDFRRLFKLTAIVVLAMLMGTISSSTCGASDPMDPAEALRGSVGNLVDAAMVEFRARRTPLSNDAAPELIEALLTAGRCDEAYKLMLSVPGESFQLYCRAMAEAGRADEVPQKVKGFENASPVKQLVADQELPFEQVYTFSLLHGKALRCVSQGKFDAALEELQALDGMKRFSGEFDNIAKSVILAIHRKSGAKASLAAIAGFTKDQPQRLKDVTRSLAMKLSTKEVLALIELLSDRHSRTYVAEM